jgi:hypothetical protein
VTELVPAVMVPVSVPPNVPVPVFRLRLTPVPVTTLAALPFASWDCTTTLKAVPAVGLDPPLTEVIASFVAGPGVNVTPAVCVIAVPLMVTDTVLDSATVDINVAVVWPLASVAVVGCTSVLPVPVAATTTFAAGIPVIKLLFASLAVTVMVVVVVPSAVSELGLAEIVELAALAGQT